MKMCLVNFAKGVRYEKGSIRLKRTFVENGYKGDFAFYTDEKELGCLSHKELPYAFKAYALKRAYEAGYEIVIWADALIMLVVPFSKVLDYTLKNKYLLPNNGWNSGQWCADTALIPLGITREESFKIPHMMACLMCLDLREGVCIEFLKSYYEKSADGITLKGAWRNDRGQVSKDKRVLGHRHDQTAASVIAYKLGMKFDNYLLTYESDSSDWQDTILFTNKGAI